MVMLEQVMAVQVEQQEQQVQQVLEHTKVMSILALEEQQVVQEQILTITDLQEQVINKE
jgi:hypothetical protein